MFHCTDEVVQSDDCTLLALFPAAILCPTLENPLNGAVDVPSMVVGAIVTYSCNEGYNISGNGMRTCEETGMWNGVEPTCESRYFWKPRSKHVYIHT